MKYNKETVKKIKDAQKAPPEHEPMTSEEFLEWLNEPEPPPDPTKQSQL